MLNDNAHQSGYSERDFNIIYVLHPRYLTPGLPCSSDGKESACSAGDLSSIPGLGRSHREGHGNPLQYSCLENPMDRGAWRAAVHGVSKSWTQLSDYHCCHILRPRYVATEVCSDKCLSFTTLDGFSSRKIQHSSTDRKHNVRRNNRLLTQTAPGLARHWVTICPCVPDLSHLGFSLFNLYNIIDNT